MTEQELSNKIRSIVDHIEGGGVGDFAGCLSYVDETCKELEAFILSDRDQFAIGFAEWLKHSDYESLESTNNVHEYGNIWNNESMTYAISELLDLYKQSLTKTEKK